MASFILTVQASASYITQAPLLEVLVEGFVVASGVVTGKTGAGVTTLTFALDYTGATYPTSLQFRFDDGQAEGGRSVVLEAVQINSQAVDPADISLTSLNQGQTSGLDAAANDHLFGQIDTGVADFDPVTTTGTSADDHLGGGSADNVIDAQAGNDEVYGGNGNDQIDGGLGNDRIMGGADNDWIVGGAGDDTLFGGTEDDLILGEDGNDTLFGGTGNDFIGGGLGNDYLFGELGDDVLDGGGDNDIILGGDGNDIARGGAGMDVLLGEVGNDTLYGGDGNDMISGGLGDDTLLGEQGDDMIDGGQGNDQIDGGLGNDLLAGRAGDDFLYGQDDNDTLYGEGGNDTLYGGTGQDSLLGGEGTDTLYGEAGADLLYGHSIDGVAAYQIEAANNVIFSEETNSFYRLVTTAATYSVAEAAATAITINGSLGHIVTISSAIENAFVHTLAAGNEIWIGASDSGSEGTWRWRGGDESGTAFYDQTSSQPLNNLYSNWNAGEPNDWGSGEDNAVMRSDGLWNDLDGVGNSRAYVIEWEAGSMYDDALADVLYGGADDDLLYGNGGNDMLSGDAGADIINGGSGADTLNGGAGNDLLLGGDGADVLNGDAGDDILFSLIDATSSLDRLSNQILANNPVAYWRLNDMSGSTAINLGSASGIDGTYTNGVLLGQSSLYVGGDVTADFDGTNDYVDIPDSSAINTTSVATRTIEFVFRADSTTARQVLYEEGGAINAITLYIENDQIYLNATDTGGPGWGPFAITAPINAGQTYHVAFVIDNPNSQVRGYLDGVQIGSGVIDGPLSSHSGDIGIGAMNQDSYFHDGPASGTGLYFNGRMAELAIYNSVLPDEEIVNHANALTVGADPFGDADTDTLNGGDGNDTLYASGGNDVLNGDAGNDVLFGGPGSNMLAGGGGDDTIYADFGQAPLSGGNNGYAQSVLALDPVGYWQLNDSSGTTAINLGSGSTGIDGVYTNGPTLGQGELYIGGQASTLFDGTNDHVHIPDSGLINTSQIAARTIELVFNANTTAGRQVLWEEGGGTNALTIYIDNGNLYFNGRDGNGALWGPFNINTPINAGQTYHAALVLDSAGGQLRGYLDGTLVGTGAVDGPINSHGGDIGIGGMNNSNYFHDGAASGDGFYFNGRITDVAVYNSVISQADLQDHADMVAGLIPGGVPAIDDVILGGDGLDDLYGGNGRDSFVFEASTAFNNVDVIHDYDYLGGDTIDISDVLTGYTPGVDSLADFVQFNEVGGDSFLQLDANGTVGGVSFSSVAQIIGITGLDVDVMEGNGNLVTV